MRRLVKRRWPMTRGASAAAAIGATEIGAAGARPLMVDMVGLAAAYEGNEFDGVTFGEGLSGVVLFGDQGAVEFDGAGGVVEAEVAEKVGDRGVFGERFGFAVDDDEHGRV